MANDNDPRVSCYLIILPNDATSDETPVTVKFQTMPERITDTKSAAFDDARIIGRSSPLKTYQFSSARKINLTLEFFASLESKDLDATTNGANNVKKTVNTLRALVNPNYTSSVIQRPRKCLVRVGDNIALIGFCMHVTVTYRGDYPWELNPYLAHYASVNLSFEDTGEKVYSFDDILAGKDFMDASTDASKAFDNSIAAANDANAAIGRF